VPVSAINALIELMICVGFGLLAGLFVRLVFMVLDMFAPKSSSDLGARGDVPGPSKIEAERRFYLNRSAFGPCCDDHSHEDERGRLVVALACEAVVRDVRRADVRQAPAAHAGDDFVTHEQSLDREMSKGEVR
jgi:hypothetical protein